MSSDDLTLEHIAAHDRQRMIPPEAEAALITGLVSRINGHVPCLDAGAGSGMITIPLARAGLDLVALDTSTAMLEVFRSRLEPGDRIQIVQGDITELPFDNASFGSALVSNVFHLVTEWRRAVRELRRVLRSDGVLLVNLGGSGELPPDLERLSELFREAMTPAPSGASATPGPRDTGEFEAYVIAQGFSPMAPLEVTYDGAITPEAVIGRLERNIFAWPTPPDPKMVRAAAEDSRKWAITTLGGLDRSYRRTQRIVYRVYS